MALELKEVGEDFSLGTQGAGRPLSPYTQEVEAALRNCEFNKVYRTRVDNLKQFVAATRAVAERHNFSVKLRHGFPSNEVPDIAADVEFKVTDRITRARKPKPEISAEDAAVLAAQVSTPNRNGGTSKASKQSTRKR